MALTGTFPRTLDEKLRVAVPKRLCDDFGEGNLSALIVAPGQDRCLLVYAPGGFERLGQKLAEQSATRLEVRNYKRLFYSRAERVDLDGQSRIRLPERLASFAGLKREVTLVGVQDHAELWDSEAWKSFLGSNEASFDEMATKAME